MRNFILLSLIVGISKCKVLEKCELAYDLAEVYNVSKWDVQRLVCVAEFESNFNTADINDANPDASKDYGVFHINNRYWCGDGFGQNICNITCESFQDNDLTDDLACIEKIIDDTKSWKDPEDGYVAWASYENRCKIQNLTEYVAECETWSPSIQATTAHAKTMSSIVLSSIPFSTTAIALKNIITIQSSIIISNSTTMRSSSSVLYTEDGDLNRTLGTTSESEYGAENVHSSNNDSATTSALPTNTNSTDPRIMWNENNATSNKLYKVIQNWLNYFNKLKKSDEHF